MSDQLFNSLAVKMAIIAGISGFAGLLLFLFCVSKIRRVSLFNIDIFQVVVVKYIP